MIPWYTCQTDHDKIWSEYFALHPADPHVCTTQNGLERRERKVRLLKSQPPPTYVAGPGQVQLNRTKGHFQWGGKFIQKGGAIRSGRANDMGRKGYRGYIENVAMKLWGKYIKIEVWVVRDNIGRRHPRHPCLSSKILSVGSSAGVF